MCVTLYLRYLNDDAIHYNLASSIFKTETKFKVKEAQHLKCKARTIASS